MHAQDLGAKDGLVLVDESFGVCRLQEFAHLGRSRLAIFLALPGGV